MTQISNTNNYINFLQTLTFNILNQTVIMYRQTPNRNQESSLRPPKMPDRPLVPYMRFSKKMWPKVRADNPDSPLWDLGKIIGQMWNSAPPTEKQVYQHEYETDKSEYEKAMKNYNATYAQYMAAKSRVKGPQEGKPTGGGGGRKGVADQQNSVTGVFIQPVDEEDPFEMAGKRLAAIRYDRNNRLMAELFSPNYMPDPRSFVTQQRIEHFRRQAQSLEQHQTKQNDELAKLEEMFNQRKRAVEKASEEYAENMKRICQEKPTQLDQAHYEKVAEEYGEQLLANWKVFEEKQAAIQAKLEADRRANPVLSDLITSKTPPANESESAMAPTERMEGEAIAVDEEKQTIVAAAVVDGEGDDGTAATSSSQNEQPNRREEETVVVNGEMDAIEAGEADEV